MGSSFSNDGSPQELCEFRKLTSTADNFEIPERPEYRRVTDRKYLITFIVFVVVLIPFLIYGLIYVDFRRFHGYDNCGNICGYENKADSRWSCTGADFRSKRYMLLSGSNFNEHFLNKECVDSCPSGYKALFTTCFPESGENGHRRNELTSEDFAAFMGEVGRDFGASWWAIIISAIISLILCFAMMALFRYAVDCVVWFILIGSIGVLAILAGIAWYAYFTYKDHRTNEGQKGFLFIAAVLSIVVVVLIIVITCMIKRVKLIIQLFKEASKSIFSVPLLILMPVWTSFATSFVFLIFFVLLVSLSFSGKLIQLAPGYLEYQPDVGIWIALGYNIFIFIWFVEFIVGIQYMVTAGAVSAWFFTRNKNYLDSPLWAATATTFRFHLGTVAIGSLIITLMAIVKAILKSLADGQKTKWLVDCCLSNIEEFVRFLSKNAYIQTAMHGQPFFKSGKRAAKLLVHNAANVIAVNSIGDFVLAIAQMLLIAVAGVIGVFICKATGVAHFWAPGIVCILIAACMAGTFFSVFEATIDCIFICFCEDTTLNDGMARPYYMSKGLMQFIEDSKAVIPAKK